LLNYQCTENIENNPYRLFRNAYIEMSFYIKI